jgi:DNA-binding MarR family transcriptional regulator
MLHIQRYYRVRLMNSPHKNSRVAPHEIGPACLAYRARMLSRIISAIYDEALAPLGLKGSQLNVLSALSRQGPCAQNDLCALLQTDKSTMSRNIERMRRRGWIAANFGEDNRTHFVNLTPKGAKLLRDALPLWRRAQEAASRRIGEEGVAALDVLVRKLRAVGDSERPARTASVSGD